MPKAVKPKMPAAKELRPLADAHPLCDPLLEKELADGGYYASAI